MRAASAGWLAFPLGALLVLACTYRTDLLAGGPPGGDGGLRTGGTTTTGPGGMGGAILAGGSTAAPGSTSTGGAGAQSDEHACASDDDCLQCEYATAPADPDQCENALGCCGGPVMNRWTCAVNQAAWEANCSGRGYKAPVCPCIACPGVTAPTCWQGKCGLWGC